MLHALVVPESGGDTMWLDLEAAFDALSPAMQEFAATFVAVHSAPRAFFVPSDTSGEQITNNLRWCALIRSRGGAVSS